MDRVPARLHTLLHILLNAHCNQISSAACEQVLSCASALDARGAPRAPLSSSIRQDQQHSHAGRVHAAPTPGQQQQLQR